MKNIIIVDDSKLFKSVMRRILGLHFNVVGTGSSGLEAIELYQKHHPDLVLLDITMPNCSGKESLMQIMKIDPEARVVMVSALGDDQTVQECLKLGAKAYISKEQISFELRDSTQMIEVLDEIINKNFSWEAA